MDGAYGVHVLCARWGLWWGWMLGTHMCVGGCAFMEWVVGGAQEWGALPGGSHMLPLVTDTIWLPPQGGKGERGLPGASGSKGEKGARVGAPAGSWGWDRM